MPQALPIPFFQFLKQGTFWTRKPRIVPATITPGPCTEFYCDPVNGSNLNSGDDQNASPTYSVTNGGWDSTTRTFTPADGSNPGLTVTVGRFASVYVDGSAQSNFFGRIVSVENAVNGRIVIHITAQMGTNPATSATLRSIRVGGAWKGPNGTVFFPFDGSPNMQGYNVTNANGNIARVNMRNNGSYLVTGAMTSAGTSVIVQGYTDVPGDGGKAIMSSSYAAGNQFGYGSGTGFHWIDIIWENTATTGTNHLMNINVQSYVYTRCIFRGARGSNFVQAGPNFFFCEFYDANKSNSASSAGVLINNVGGFFYGCYFHDQNFGAAGVRFNTGSLVQFIKCIFDGNPSDGFIQASNTSGSTFMFINCDFYNNSGHGISQPGATALGPGMIIINCNFVKNSGRGINIATLGQGGISFNNGYGSGSYRNGLTDLAQSLIRLDPDIVYSPDAVPWNAPSTGDFSLTLPAAMSVGYDYFQETTPKAGTVSYPDVGAAAAVATTGGTTIIDEGIGGVGGG